MKTYEGSLDVWVINKVPDRKCATTFYEKRIGTMRRKPLLFPMLIVSMIMLSTANRAMARSCDAREAIAAGANGQLWVLGTYKVGLNSDFQPFFWNGKEWGKVDGGLVNIAVLPDGNPVGINSEAEIWQRADAAWTRLPATADRIAVGANGQIWVLGTNHVGPGDYQPYFWDGKNWAGIDGGLTDIAVLPNGAPVGINSEGQIWQRINNVWTRLPDVAIRIAVGANGQIWILGTNHVGADGDYQPYFWDGKKWTGVDGGLIEIAVSPNGSLIGVNSQGQIWQRINNGWIRLPGAAAGC